MINKSTNNKLIIDKSSDNKFSPVTHNLFHSDLSLTDSNYSQIYHLNIDLDENQCDLISTHALYNMML